MRRKKQMYHLTPDEDLHVLPKSKAGKEAGRTFLCAIQSADDPNGFLDGAFKLFGGNKTHSNDYHKEMNALIILDLTSNNLSGSVDLTQLPSELQNLGLQYNRLVTRWKATSSWWFGPVLRRVSVLAPTLLTVSVRWWVWTSTLLWGGPGDRRLFLWGIPNPLVARRG
ncbi:hypothetical protein XU18_1088 [Perkinsela sp. CCAP 1560/4]|nr:hypothetical protein XU18_1088 [Perkinsela sp. CCAP 1560/4]|eukprot:KNH08375.1 hypothetical protein XU18_1088 [Perkinsela sp. CCAP 1560/4]